MMANSPVPMPKPPTAMARIGTVALACAEGATVAGTGKSTADDMSVQDQG